MSDYDAGNAQPNSEPKPPGEAETAIVTPAEPENVPLEVYIRNRTGCGCGQFLAGCLLIVVGMIAVVVILVVGSVTGLLSGLGGILAPPAPVAQVYNTQTIVNSIQPLGQLVSVSAQLAKADIAVSVQQSAFNLCGYSAEHVAQGTIEAGIDLTQLTPAVVDYDEATDTYTVRLPPPQLTSCRIDFIRQYNRSFTTCSVDWDEARLLANYSALADFRDDSLEAGVLRRAELEARVVVTNFIGTLTGSEVNVLFEEGSAAGMPASCDPELPRGWTRDPNTGQWVRQS